MNKYLLLRNNKQSGPYTVPEIIAMGIKPYDLVWLEGKSAAWRYPSEIDELKAYAPAVEEQPFDRFYKKPDAKNLSAPIDDAQLASVETRTLTSKKTDQPQENHDRYQPKIVPQQEENKPPKKVYINFPAANAVAAASNISTNANRAVPPVQSAPVQTDPVAATSPVQPNGPVLRRDGALKDEKEIVAERWSNMREPVQAKTQNNRLLYVAMAACALLGAVSGILLFNYYRQRTALQELSSVVQKMESEKKQQDASQTALLNETATVPSLPVAGEPGYVQSTAAIDTAVIIASVKAPSSVSTNQTVKKKNTATQGSPSIIFTETNSTNNAGRPVERRDDEAPSDEINKPVAKENLFNLVEVKPNEYKTGLLGGISNLKFELTNKSSVELQRVAVEVKYLGPEKKVVKKHTVYFENVLPGAQNTIDVPKSNRGVTIEYTVTDIKS
jgi:hypothetical protein